MACYQLMKSLIIDPFDLLLLLPLFPTLHSKRAFHGSAREAALRHQRSTGSEGGSTAFGLDASWEEEEEEDVSEIMQVTTTTATSTGGRPGSYSASPGEGSERERDRDTETQRDLKTVTERQFHRHPL